MQALLIEKGNIKWIEIEKDFDNKKARKLLKTKETISSSKRFFLGWSFRVFHKDYVPNPSFFTTMNPDDTPDIPEECIITLIEDWNDEEEILGINSVVESFLLENLFSYKNKDIIQPILKWRI